VYRKVQNVNIAVIPTNGSEPLVSLSDLDEYKDGLQHRLQGDWDEDKWTGFRTRFGVYGQKQAGVQMVRIKIPGGILPIEWLTTLAEFNRLFCQGDVHITTRQDIQTYFVPLEKSADALEFLYRNGMTTREACGNTFRNISACALSGHCPREHTDAGIVAQQLATSWIRQPLVQNMPRKVKVAVSGCATDCAGVTFHDLGFVATLRDSQPGFRVFVGGGLGSQPRPATEVLDFVTEEQLPTVMETLARIHQRYSDRVNRNAARIKFVVKRFGDEKFITLFREEFARLLALPQRPWDKLAWREPGEAAIERTPLGVVSQHDGRFSVIGNPVLGNLSSDQLDSLVVLANRTGITELRVTRDQNLVVPNVAADRLDLVLSTLKSLGIDVPLSAAESTDVVSCPGTTTCRIGITNSPGLARTVLAEAGQDAAARGVSVRISGCQNSCGQHHIGDFGLHGVAKKIDGKPAPHYQIHLGGEARLGAAREMAGMSGPIIPAGLAPLALRLLRQAYAADKAPGEKVRGWAERLGKPGIEALLAPLALETNQRTYLDWGDQEGFKGAPTLRGECAAPFASDDILANFADDALIQVDRWLALGRVNEAIGAAEQVLLLSARRLLHSQDHGTTGEETAATLFQSVAALTLPGKLAASLQDSLAALEAARRDDQLIMPLRESAALHLDHVRAALTPIELSADAAE
jgi:sulfite reductase (NADPH) hemoprotein beta-component